MLYLSAMHENELSYRVRGCIFKVYNTLGPGLLESAYEAALDFELRPEGLASRAAFHFNKF